MASPASRRPTNCSLSSMTEHSFQGITPSQKTGGSVTHVSGTMCYLCLRPLSPVRPGDIGDSSYRRHGLHFWAERIFDRFEHSSLQIKVSQIIIHKAHQPNVVVDFSDADGLTGE